MSATLGHSAATKAAIAAASAGRAAERAISAAEEGEDAVFNVHPVYLPYCLGCETGAEAAHEWSHPVTGVSAYHPQCYFAQPRQ